MFGYVLPYKADLKVSQWYTYKAVYCGLCKELKRKYGFFARLFLNYDFVLLALVCDSLQTENIDFGTERCIANPIQKQITCKSTPGLSLAADSLMLTAFYKIKDNLNDDKLLKKVPSMLMYPLSNNFRKKAADRYEQLDKTLASLTLDQQKIESENTNSADAIAEPSAKMTAALFEAAANDENKSKMYRFGYFLGKIIYYLDAAEDYEKDKKNGAYNFFVNQNYTKQQTVSEVQRLCNLCAGEMSLCYNLINFTHYKPILDNILYLGLPQCILNAGNPVKKQTGGSLK